MSALKVLVTGGSGLLGQYLNLVLNESYSLVTLYNSEKRNCSQFNSRRLFLENETDILNLLKEENPNIVIHAGAVSNPIIADKIGNALTNKINVSATKVISQFCSESNAKLVYISTDLVYDGNSGSYIDENSKLNPISLYAESKLEAEFAVQKYSNNYLILRMALMFGKGLNGSQNFFTYMMENLKDNKPVNLFTDQYRTPLELSESARMIKEVITKECSNQIINFGGRDRISRYEMGQLICKKYGFDKSLLIKTKMSEIKNYKAVYDVSMNTDRLKNLGIVPKSINELI